MEHDDTVHDDVLKLAQYFEKKFHTLEKAASQFDPSIEWDVHSFIFELKRWGVDCSEPYELFAHIDVDFSGRISLDELFAVLSQPIAEVAERDKRRLELEVTRIYEELAARIRTEFQGSIEDAFRAIGATPEQGQGHGVQGLSISMAQFRRLLHKMQMDLTPGQVDRVFRQVDVDKTGDVSVQELRHSLGFYMVRGDLIALASHLTELHGSVAAAFETRQRTGTGMPGAGLPPTLPGAGLPPTLPGSPTGLGGLPIGSVGSMGSAPSATMLNTEEDFFEASAASESAWRRS